MPRRVPEAAPPGTSSAPTSSPTSTSSWACSSSSWSPSGPGRTPSSAGSSFINSGIGIVQEMRAKVALDRLTMLTAPAAKVVRDGATKEIPMAHVVLDDVVEIVGRRPDRGRRGDAPVPEPGGGRVAAHRRVGAHQQGARGPPALRQLRGSGERPLPHHRGGSRRLRAAPDRGGQALRAPALRADERASTTSCA